MKIEEQINNIENKKLKYFGTDGFRGEANINLTGEIAFKIGRFLGWYYSHNTNLKIKNNKFYHPKILIGKDTRKSSYMLEYAISAGLASSGAYVYLMHVTTSPSISYLINSDGFDLGIMITASHNPFYDNGIKILNSCGEKLVDEILIKIESYLDDNLKSLGIKDDDLPYAKRENIGTINDYYIGRNRYIGHLISIPTYSFKNYKIGLDTSNGSSYEIAKNVFESLGASVYMVNNNPNGLNINLNAGSTHIDCLSKFVKDNKLDVGFAYDGDADRCLAIDENGDVVDGDKILFILANKLIREKSLLNNTVVITIMSNLGLKKALDNIKVKYVETKVGDKYVYEEMKKNNYYLGGEQSGHIIYKKYASTGDGILTSLLVMEEIIKNNVTLSKLVKPVKLYPQILKNVIVTSKEKVMNDAGVKLFIKKEMNLLKEGRILVRESGTEPVIRIMVESNSKKECIFHINRIVNFIKKKGFINE